MTHAFAGKILQVDLSSRKIATAPLDEKKTLKYLGSRGFGAYLLWEMVPRGIEPLGPENVLIFGTGTLTGTSAPTSGRTTVTCKGPATGLYLKTNVGGHWGTELKFAGYDFLVITGRAEKPVYLLISDDRVEIRDAGALWGKDVRETTQAIEQEHGDREIQVACIGPAGENKVLFASIRSNYYNAAARGGPGAVMGSKKLKAIAVRGNGRDGKPIWPRAFCDFAGNITVIKQASSHAMMERIQKHLSMTTIGLIGGAGHVLNGGEMKRLINHGSISRCLNIGRLLREARQKGDEAPAYVAKELDGWVLFTGVVEEKPWESKQGYMFGHFEMSGVGGFSGHSFKVWFQNENMISWLDGKPYVTCPDPLCVIDLDTGMPPNNDEIKPGNRLAIIGLRAVEFYRQPQGLKVLSPPFFGFDIPYRPIEKIMAGES